MSDDGNNSVLNGLLSDVNVQLDHIDATKQHQSSKSRYKSTRIGGAGGGKGGSGLLEPLIQRDEYGGQLDMVEEEKARRTREERIRR